MFRSHPRPFVSDLFHSITHASFSFNKVFPKCTLWTTYPLHVVIKSVFERVEAEYRSRPPSSSPFRPTYLYYATSLLAALERMLATAFSGAPNLMIRKPMDKLWLSRGYLSSGYPSLDSRIVSFNWTTNPDTRQQALHVKINHELWPLDAKNFVATMYDRGVALTISPAFATVSSPSFLIGHYSVWDESIRPHSPSLISSS